jgi:SAM-dependent methyltransferase
MPDAPRLYSDLARLWPHLSPPEHYAAESEALCELIFDALGEPPAGRRWSVLELGAGGGHSAVHLKQRFDITAADLSPQMLALCNTLNPDVPTVFGDMRDMRLDRTFDAVLICDAIDYMLTEDDAVAAFKTAAAHLRPGGVVLAAPTYTRETFVDGDVADDGTTVPGIAGDDELTYFTFVHDPDPIDTTFEMILLYLIRDAKTRAVEVVEDRHACGLFSIEQWRALMARAGLEAEALAEPRHDADAEDASAWSVLFRGSKRG